MLDGSTVCITVPLSERCALVFALRLFLLKPEEEAEEKI
jgi:hypothetical protein